MKTLLKVEKLLNKGIILVSLAICTSYMMLLLLSINAH